MVTRHKNMIIKNKDKKWKFLISVNGNLKIEYLDKAKQYVITRTDGKRFDGCTEKVGAEFLGNMKDPENLNEMVEYEVNLFSSLQTAVGVNDFIYFDWFFNDDKTKIIVSPIFLIHSKSVMGNFYIPSSDKINVLFGNRKFVRKGDMLEDTKKLRLKNR